MHSLTWLVALSIYFCVWFIRWRGHTWPSEFGCCCFCLQCGNKCSLLDIFITVSLLHNPLERSCGKLSSLCFIPYTWNWFGGTQCFLRTWYPALPDGRRARLPACDCLCSRVGLLAWLMLLAVWVYTGSVPLLDFCLKCLWFIFSLLNWVHTWYIEISTLGSIKFITVLPKGFCQVLDSTSLCSVLSQSWYQTGAGAQEENLQVLKVNA